VLQGQALIEQITPMVLTYNEGPNIERVLSRLAWASRVVVVDSGSTDETVHIVQRYPHVTLLTREFDSAAAQCNFGLDHVQTRWVLSLDADYVLSERLVEELREMRDTQDVFAYRARFIYCVYGRPLRGALYPARTVLYRKETSRYIDEGHTQRIVVLGKVEVLTGAIFHDDRKPLSRWLTSQQRYARLEAERLLTAPTAQLSRSARIRRMAFPAPLLVFIYVLIVKGCIFDGWIGCFYAFQRLLAETMLALELIDQRLSARSKGIE
jgi:glycosyltransferase involved in cell wall biosynthesis